MSSDSDAIITVENLGKKYILRHQQNERYVALRDVLTEKAAAPFLWLRAGRQRDNGTTGRQDQSQVVRSQLSSSPQSEEFWALRDINFEVAR
jgi:lipopolysaccharide transport system ATP-binding protein